MEKYIIRCFELVFCGKWDSEWESDDLLRQSGFKKWHLFQTQTWLVGMYKEAGFGNLVYVSLAREFWLQLLIPAHLCSVQLLQRQKFRDDCWYNPLITKNVVCTFSMMWKNVLGVKHGRLVYLYLGQTYKTIDCHLHTFLQKVEISCCFERNRSPNVTKSLYLMNYELRIH